MFFPLARQNASRSINQMGFRSFNNQAMTYFQKKSLPTNTVINFVPQQQAWIVERMGKFSRVLSPGPNFLIPFFEKIQYVQSLKEAAVQIDRQAAITSDNVTLHLDGVLYIKVFDAIKASYGVEDAQYAVTQLAQTAMRSEIGKLSLQQVLRERQTLNELITAAINEAADAWGMKCLRHEIKDIQPPKDVLDAMHRQVSSERAKRAEILESEGHKQAAINQAEGGKQMNILQAEGVAKSIELISNAMRDQEFGKDAVTLQLAKNYIEAFEKLAQKGTSVIIPAKLDDIGGMVAGGLSIFDNVKHAQQKQGEPKK